MAPISFAQTFGSIAGWTLAVARRAAVPGDAVSSASVLAVTLSKDASTYEVAAIENGSEAPGRATAVARGILAAFAAIDGSLTLGAPGQAAIPAGGTADASTYMKAAKITPGTPVPPGRGVYITDLSGLGGLVTLKLAGGGTLRVTVAYNEPKRIDGVAVVDWVAAPEANQCEVTVLY